MAVINSIQTVSFTHRNSHVSKSTEVQCGNTKYIQLHIVVYCESVGTPNRHIMIHDERRRLNRFNVYRMTARVSVCISQSIKEIQTQTCATHTLDCSTHSHIHMHLMQCDRLDRICVVIFGSCNTHSLFTAALLYS